MQLDEKWDRDLALDTLKEDYGIKVSNNPSYPFLYCLNYDQIKSDKHSPIVQECRSLVIEYNGWTFNVVSRSFDRFFNYNETPSTSDIDITKLEAFEKIDGSLIGLFNYEGEWLYRTRSMIMPDESMVINGTDLTWKKLIEGCLGDGYESLLDDEATYILELTSPENRVVTRYDERKCYLLAVRDNDTGEYRDFSREVLQDKGCTWEYPRRYQFNTMDDCLKAVKSLPNLEEGYVMYDKEGVPVMKVKSPAYVAAHRLRGESVLTGKRVMDMIFTKEHEEYLSIFPEDQDIFDKYLEAYYEMKAEAVLVYGKYCNIKTQKEFALAVKDYPFSSVLFQLRRDNSEDFNHYFDKLNPNSKYSMVEAFL